MRLEAYHGKLHGVTKNVYFWSTFRFSTLEMEVNTRRTYFAGVRTCGSTVPYRPFLLLTHGCITSSFILYKINKTHGTIIEKNLMKIENISHVGMFANSVSIRAVY